MTGEVAYEFLVNFPNTTARFTGILGLPYPFAQEGAPDAKLTVRERPESRRREVSRTLWKFVPSLDGGLPQQLQLEGGFQPGHLYELTYTARDPVVVGLGMAGIRDLLAYLRVHPIEGVRPPTRTLIFGISQSGRLIQTMVFRWLHVGETGEPVFDGAFVHVAGGGKGSFDYRFAMPTRHFSMLEDHIYPTDYFPFTTTIESDPVTGASGSVLDCGRSTASVRYEPVASWPPGPSRRRSARSWSSCIAMVSARRGRCASTRPTAAMPCRSCRRIPIAWPATSVAAATSN